MTAAPDLDWTDVTDAPGPRGVVDLARLVWAARAEASRLHRLIVAAERHRQHIHQLLEQADARIYRCPGCGDWRYDSEFRQPGSRRTCSACGARRPANAPRRAA